MISDQSRRQKSREVSSRYLSSIVAPPSPSPSPPLAPNHNHITTKQKQKHKHTAFIRGLWPHSSKSHDENRPSTTLADHLHHERRKAGVKRSDDSPYLSKQKSCSEFSRSDNSSSTKNNNILKEYHTPVYGGSGSMRYNGKLMFQGRSSISSSTSSSDIFEPNQVILPGRLSVDENVLHRRTSYYQTRADSYSDNSESSDLGSPFTTGRNTYMAPTLSSKSYSMSSTFNSLPIHNSFKKSMSMKRANSSSESSTSRSFGSPSFSTSKPPSVSKGKKNLLHIGLDLIKGKKGGSKLRSSSGSDTGTNGENVHQLRLLHNSLMQWRYANARAEVVHDNLSAQCKNDLFYASESMAKLRQSVVQKRLQLQKEKLEMKLNLILHSQMKMLEAWGDIERRHIVDISVMKDYLHAVVCIIPLIEGAKVDLESATISFRHTSHLVGTIKSMLSTFSPTAHDMLSELAEVVSQEKLLLEECFEHLKIISSLEMQETNLRCCIMALDSLKE